MGLSDNQIASIKRLSDDDLVRNAQTDDLASIVKSNLRLKESSETLTKVLIRLTKVLILLTWFLVALTVPLLGIEIYHSISK